MERSQTLYLDTLGVCPWKDCGDTIGLAAAGPRRSARRSATVSVHGLDKLEGLLMDGFLPEGWAFALRAFDAQCI